MSPAFVCWAGRGSIGYSADGYASWRATHVGLLVVSRSGAGAGLHEVPCARNAPVRQGELQIAKCSKLKIVNWRAMQIVNRPSESVVCGYHRLFSRVEGQV